MNKICCLHFLHCLLLGATQECVFNENSDQPNIGRVCCMTNDPTPGKAYNDKTQICCNGTIHDRNGQQCCNGVLYDPNEKICCGAELHIRPQASSVCCGGVIHAGSQRCCGGLELYNYSTQICCKYNGSFSIAPIHNQSCCYDKNYDINTEHCVSNKVLNLDEDLCGDTIFSRNTNIKCCGEKLHEIQPNSTLNCCGEDLYDPTKEKCCKAYNTIVPIGQECCGNGSISVSTQMCCNGVAHEKESNMTCCGTGLVDDVTKGCCATKPYNMSTHRCHDAIIRLKQKCNSREYNITYPIVPRSGICRVCMRNNKYIRKQIKEGNWSVCKQHKYKITTNRSVRSGRFWIMHGKLIKNETNEREVRLIFPCKCCKVNNTREFVLLTDVDVHRRTVRLGDGDLLLTHNQRLEKVINRKRNRCRNAGLSWFVEQMKKRAMKQVGEFIDKILPK